jgi:hypothetical protein
MIVMTEGRRCLGRVTVCVALLLPFAAGCGSDGTTLVIANEQGSGSSQSLAITRVLIRQCLSRFWQPSDPALDPMRDLPAEGVVSIEHGSSHSFELEPGCHDFVATRDSDTSARARVVLDVGESAVWVPFRIDENESWWCSDDDCDD